MRANNVRGLRTANDKTQWIEARRRQPANERPRGCPDDSSLLTWLAKSKPGRSWREVARAYFPETKRKDAAISKARRAYAAVERFLNPSERQFRAECLDARIKEHFDCSPREFKDYLEGL